MSTEKQDHGAPGVLIRKYLIVFWHRFYSPASSKRKIYFEEKALWLLVTKKSSFGSVNMVLWGDFTLFPTISIGILIFFLHLVMFYGMVI